MKSLTYLWYLTLNKFLIPLYAELNTINKYFKKHSLQLMSAVLLGLSISYFKVFY